jgi:hypothetical protein
MRLWNEGATLILFCCRILSYSKSRKKLDLWSSWNFLFSIIMLGFKFYKAIREKPILKHAKQFQIIVLSLRVRIFLMIVLIITASILLASISIIQFKNEAKSTIERLERKVIKEHINYVLHNNLSFKHRKLRPHI